MPICQAVINIINDGALFLSQNLLDSIGGKMSSFDSGTCHQASMEFQRFTSSLKPCVQTATQTMQKN